ncbi:MAG: hypothetical protein LBL69_05830, partial [Zoogloeaceae bacterium]|nr:hypothetical protein [Zoogloeaceae bacterium]
MKTGCVCEIRDEGGFENWQDYGEFEQEINSLDCFDKVTVDYQNTRNLGSWDGKNCYRCKKCHYVWNLTKPDPPFIGYWGKVQFKSKFDFIPVGHFSSCADYKKTRAW